MKRILHGALGALALTLMVASPALADDAAVKRCISIVKSECAQAMEDARWYEVLAVSVICTAAYGGCAIVHNTPAPT